MSVVFSGTLQGSFTSTGAAQLINLPTGVDYMYVRNWTRMIAAPADTGLEWWWQFGMPQGSGIVYNGTVVTGAMVPAQVAAPLGFYTFDNTINVPGPAIATTGISGALPPVVTTGTTTGLSDGDIVRLYSPVGALQLGGMDFTVDSVVAATSFALINMPAIAASTPAAGTYRRIPYNPYFYPSSRYITKISQAAQALVTLSVTHNYTVGQVVRFVVPVVTAAAYGMSELNGLQGTIVAINATDGTSTNTITVDIDTTGFTAFALPLTANPYHTFAQVVPMGQNTADSLLLGTDLLGGATLNTGERGIMLMPDNVTEQGPAGTAGDLVYWVAGKSQNV
jgi:hypothetical protein